MRRRRWTLIAAAVATVALAGGGLWYFVFRDTAPPEVSLERATRALRDRTSPTTARADDTLGSVPNLDGRWSVDPTIGSFADFTSSFAGFRVQEELVGIGAKTAVGRTPKVSGSITIQGTAVPTASFEVDMTSLTTDDARRDNALRSQAIETTRFPTASFTLTQPIQLGRIPAEGEKVSVEAIGNLTLHGVTKPITIPIEARRSGDVIAVVGSVEIRFADYAIAQPRAAAVLSVEDRGIIEVQLFFRKTS